MDLMLRQDDYLVIDVGDYWNNIMMSMILLYNINMCENAL